MRRRNAKGSSDIFGLILLAGGAALAWYLYTQSQQPQQLSGTQALAAQAQNVAALLSQGGLVAAPAQTPAQILAATPAPPTPVAPGASGFGCPCWF